MIIRSPVENERVDIILDTEHDQMFRVKIVNDTDQTLSIDENSFQFKISSLPEWDENAEQRNQTLKAIIEKKIGEFIQPQLDNRIFFRPKLHLEPENELLLTIPLGALSHNFDFREPRQFEACMTLFEEKRRFMILTKRQEPIDPLPDGEPMLTYHGNTPFILNLNENNTLELRLDENGDQWVDIASKPPHLKTDIGIEISAEGEISDSLKTRAISLFDVKNPTVRKYKQDQIVIILPMKGQDDNPVEQDLPITLTVSLGEARGEIPALLQRPSYQGFAVIDFGTTHSASVYYSFENRPHFPDRNLSPLQVNALQKTVESLMKELEEDAIKNPDKEPLVTRLVNFAGHLWVQQEKRPPSNMAEVRQGFQNFHHQQNQQVYNMYANLLVAFGTHDYSQFCNIYPKLAKDLAHKYHKCLGQVMGINIQEDIGMRLPQLEKGGEAGKIYSAILMDRLVAQSDRNDEKAYSAINVDQSKIRMGTAVKLAMDAPADNQIQTDQLRYPYYRHYVTGVKRWLGQSRQKAYFIDREDNFREDNYDPLCTLGMKYLIQQTENNLGGGKRALNDLTVTYPTNLPLHRRQHLKQLVSSLGVKNVDIRFDEATAGALYYVWRELFTDLFAGVDGFLARSRVKKESKISKRTGREEQVDLYFQNILLYDMGGGTTDIALLEIGIAEDKNILQGAVAKNPGRYFVIYPKILGLTGKDDFAGDNVTLAVFHILKAKLAARMVEKSPQQPNFSQALQHIIETQNKACLTQWIEERNYETAECKIGNDDSIRVKTLINELVPTDFQTDSSRQKGFFALWQEAENIKHQLSENGVTRVDADNLRLEEVISSLKLGIQAEDLLDIYVTLDEMEGQVAPNICNTFERARELCVGESGCLMHYIDKVVLAGNSSQLPLVHETALEVLGRSFNVTLDGQIKKLPAPFKYDGDNLIFDPKEAKLAVARGACLPHFFSRVNVLPNDPSVTKALQKGHSFLYFDIDNLRGYIPFNLGYQIGIGHELTFQVGSPFNVILANKRKLSRKVVFYQPELVWYRQDSVAQIDGAVKDESRYATFKLDAAIQNYKDHAQDNRTVEELATRFLFYVTFDEDRDLKCYMYTNLDGNAKEYVRLKATSERDRNELMAAICRQENGNWILKPELVFHCDIGKLGGEPEEVRFAQKGGELKAEIAMRDKVHLRSSTERNDMLLWAIDTSGYTVKNPELVKMHLFLKTTEAGPVLEYTIYDPDFEDESCNEEIKCSFDETRGPTLFNPFGGEE
jgi:molecular chaperone DnaK (HSP70)